MTYDELLRIAPLDNLWHEIIDGEHVARGGAEIAHQRVLGNLLFIIANFLHEHRIGEVILRPLDVVLSPRDVLQPDIFYVAKEREHIWSGHGTNGPPDLTIEILDDESRRRDEIAKRRAYERFGVGEYWIVDRHAESVKVYRRDASGSFAHPLLITAAEDRVLTTPLIPGLTINLAEVFEE